MIRTIITVSACLLATSSIAHAEDREAALINLGHAPYQWGVKHQYFHRVDMNMSLREYEETYRGNRRLVRNNLVSFSRDTLESIGIPKQGVNLMGAALGVVINGARLDLNKSKTLALEFKDVGNTERSLFFGFKLKW